MLEVKWMCSFDILVLDFITKVAAITICKIFYKIFNSGWCNIFCTEYQILHEKSCREKRLCRYEKNEQTTFSLINGLGLKTVRSVKWRHVTSRSFFCWSDVIMIYDVNSFLIHLLICICWSFVLSYKELYFHISYMLIMPFRKSNFKFEN